MGAVGSSRTPHRSHFGYDLSTADRSRPPSVGCAIKFLICPPSAACWTSSEIARSPKARPLLPMIMSAAGVLSIGPSPQTDEVVRATSSYFRTAAPRRRARLVIRSSKRGGWGQDVFIEWNGHKPTNLSDCGDDFGGQPSLSADGTRVLWIRSPAL